MGLDLCQKFYLSGWGILFEVGFWEGRTWVWIFVWGVGEVFFLN